MARIKYTALVDSISGSIGGSTLQRNGYGHSMSSKSYPKQSGSVLQMTRRCQMLLVNNSWANLTQSQRGSWSSYALVYQKSCKHNSAKFLNGFNYFQKYHLLRILSGDQTVLSNPTFSNIPLEYRYTEPLVLSGGFLYFILTVATTSSSWIAVVTSSSTLKASRNFNHAPMRYLVSGTGGFSADEILYELDMYSQIQSAFGKLPAIGDSLCIQVSLYHPSTGQFIVFAKQPIVIE
jgi:hypothetical protein